MLDVGKVLRPARYSLHLDQIIIAHKRRLDLIRQVNMMCCLEGASKINGTFHEEINFGRWMGRTVQ